MCFPYFPHKEQHDVKSFSRPSVQAQRDPLVSNRGRNVRIWCTINVCVKKFSSGTKQRAGKQFSPVTHCVQGKYSSPGSLFHNGNEISPFCLASLLLKHGRCNSMQACATEVWLSLTFQHKQPFLMEKCSLDWWDWNATATLCFTAAKPFKVKQDF